MVKIEIFWLILYQVKFLSKLLTLKKILKNLKNNIKNDDSKKVILFSPSAASFDQFKNFEERGKFFNKNIKYIIRSKNMSNYLDSFYYWWKNIDKFLLFLILGLFLLGLFFSLVSTSLIASDKLDTKSYYFFFKHSAYITLAILILILFSFLNPKILTKISFILFLIAFLSLLLVPFIGIGKRIKRWLDLFFYRFQPVEIIKPFFIVTLS